MNNKPNYTEIREAYVWFDKYIVERFKETGCVSRWVSPYLVGFDFMSIFTPIEFMTWQALRSYGHAPLYPQYPVDKYFLDFGNPIVKVGIECDGKEFHTDKEKDYLRDTALHNLGWTIYRISGADCHRIIKPEEISEQPYQDELYNKRYDYVMNTIEGLIESLGVRYFNQMYYGDPEPQINLMCKCLRKRVSIPTNEWDEGLGDTISTYYDKYYEMIKQ